MGKFQDTNLNSLRPTLTHFNLYQPTFTILTNFNLSHTKKFNPLQPISTYLNLLQLSSSFYTPQFTHEKNGPLVSVIEEKVLCYACELSLHGLYLNISFGV